MSEQQISPLFHQLVDQYASLFTPDIVEMMHQNWEHGEAVIAFEDLPDNLQAVDASVDDEARQKLRAIAEGLDLLDSPSGKGVYW